jgi:sec-independent protein translocase protein TatA
MFLAGGPFGLGPLELFLIVVVLLLVFGVSKLADIGGSLGTGIREFRKNVRDDPADPSPPAAVTSPPAAPVVSPPLATDPEQANGGAVVAAVKCPSCGSLNPMGARHCNQCGTSLAAPVS